MVLRFGMLPSPSASAPTISVRAEAREAAAASLASPPFPDLSGPGAAPYAPLWPAGAGRPAAGPGPVFQPYRPEEWVSLVAQHLQLGDQQVTRAALWVARLPVQVTLSRREVCLRLTLRAP